MGIEDRVRPRPDICRALFNGGRVKSRLCFFLLLTVLSDLSLGQPNPAPPPPDASRMFFDGKWAGDAKFEAQAWALSADQRQKVLDLMTRPARLLEHKQEWCMTQYWVLQGIADPSEGPEAKRRQLSLKRADSVAALLVAHGVARSDICVTARRTDVPALPAGQVHRRVEIEFLCGKPEVPFAGTC